MACGHLATVCPMSICSNDAAFCRSGVPKCIRSFTSLGYSNRTGLVSAVLAVAELVIGLGLTCKWLRLLLLTCCFLCLTGIAIDRLVYSSSHRQPAHGEHA